MNALKAAWVVYRKELTDTLRDRRTWMVVLLTSMVAGPLSLLLISTMVSDIEAAIAKREVVIEGRAHAPGLVNFLERAGATVIDAPADWRRQVKSGALANAVVVVPEAFEAKLARAELAPLELVFDDSGTRAPAATRATTQLLRAYAREVASLRLAARGVAPALVNPIEVVETNLAPGQARNAQLLFFIPWLALLGAVVGAVSVAIDVTAGERERGSLEPLLANPVATGALAVGKWGVVTTAASAVILLTLAGFSVAMLAIKSESLAALMQFGARELGLFLVMLLPFAAFVASLLMLAATWGRSYKEAQTYASYITMLVNFVPILPLFLSLRDAPWQLAVPAMAQQQVLIRALRGEPVSGFDLLAPGAMAIVLTAVCLVLLARLLRAERIVFAR
ncbi:MAG: ABC transporter permease subunit [Burkholderiaceae bacterium]